MLAFMTFELQKHELDTGDSQSSFIIQVPITSESKHKVHPYWGEQCLSHKTTEKIEKSTKEREISRKKVEKKRIKRRTMKKEKGREKSDKD